MSIKPIFNATTGKLDFISEEFLGELAAFPTTASDGDYFYHTTEGAYYFFSDGVWKIFNPDGVYKDEVWDENFSSTGLSVTSGRLSPTNNDAIPDPSFEGEWEQLGTTSERPAGWNKSGSGGTYREETIVHDGVYAWKMNSGATVSYTFTTALGMGYWAGKTVTFTCRCYHSSASKLRIALTYYDGSTNYTYSDYHTGGSTWQQLTVSLEIPAGAINAGVSIYSGSFPSTSYIDLASVKLSTVSGTRISNPIPLASIKSYSESTITWVGDGDVSTAITTSATEEPGAWSAATSGTSVPDFVVGTDYSDKYLWIKQDLVDEEYFDSLNVEVKTATDLSVYLKLDQTTAQAITGGTPKLDSLKNKKLLGTDVNGAIVEGNITGEVLTDLADVTIIGRPTDGSLLKWTEAYGVWSDGWANISELADVDLTDIQHGDKLAYNTEQEKWYPQADTIYTAGTGIIFGELADGYSISNSDPGSSAVTSHESTYNHANFVPYTGATTNVNLATRTLYTSTGKIGLGTDSPTYDLETHGTAVENGIRSWMGYDIYLVPSPETISVAASAGGSVTVGAHYYLVTFYTATGETLPKYSSQITITSGDQTVTVTIPTSTDSRVVGRKIYKTKAGGFQWQEYLLTTIADNTTTEYVDTAADDAGAPVGVVYFKPNTTSQYITINGVRALMVDLNLVALGVNNGLNLTTGGRSTLLGANAGAALTTANDSTFFGYRAGVKVTTAAGVSLFGSYAGANAVSAVRATLFGNQAGYNLSTGNDNVGFGVNALHNVTTSNTNIGLGNYSGRYIGSGTTTNQTPTGCIYIGYDARAKAASQQNEIILGSHAIGNGSNTVTLGDDNVTAVYAGEVGGATSIAGKFQLSALNTAPASAAATGTAGEIRIDANHIYVCTATDTWKRVAIATW